MARRRATSSTGSHGGRRRGAGRKPSEVKRLREEFIRAADDFLVPRTEELLGLMLGLARGGHERVEIVMEPAELVFVERICRDQGGNILYANGRPVVEKVRAYPDAEPGTWVPTKRKTSVAEPNRGAITDLLNRIVGRPREAREIAQAAPDRLPSVLEIALKRAYASQPENEAPPEPQPEEPAEP